ncbi:ATP-binding protein [Deinococcus yavapaiensis]|uniref:histidine kinase n=1 Tax=Deinococcus yavapaiensis KR-236 TaxID=694435 RepID=A0A318SAM9_9DEIO|nr:ATP-binding protein [Deinococcus yavapaiensis]PYE56419.1 PAS domain S-box-containing protein [Deinococcus yavapaiensis KR-236]
MKPDERSESAAQAMARLALALATTKTPDDVMAAVLKHGLIAVGATAGNVFLLDDTTSLLRLASSRGYSHGFMDAHASLSLDAPLPVTRSVLDGHARFLTADDVASGYPWIPRDPLGGAGRVAALPLTVSGASFGVIALTYAYDAPFSKAEQETLTTVASLCAQSLKRALLAASTERQERRTAQILDSLGDAVVTVDADERVTFANVSACEWLGHGEPLEGRLLADILRDPEARDLLGAVRATRFDGASWRGEVLLWHGTRWFDVRTATLDAAGAVVHMREVTHRKTVERQLRHSRERLLLALEAANMAMWDWNLETGELAWTGQMHVLLGASPTAPVSFDTFVAQVHPDDRARLARIVGDLIENGGVYDEEFRVVHPDGVVRWLQGVGDVRREGGRSVRSVGVNFDVTARKDLERALREANEHLEAQVAQRTARLQDLNAELLAMAASMSRDLSEPVRRVMGFLALLQRRYGAVFENREAALFELVREEAERAATLIEELAHLTRHERVTLDVKRVPMDLLIAQVVSDLAREVQGRRVEWAVAPLPVVNGDPRLLRLAFTSLLHNALRFTRFRDVARIEVGSERTGNEVRVWVRDNGAGFDAEDAPRVFQLFTRLHPEGSGTGVSLAHVRRVIERHGGRVEAYGEVGVGATFTVILPL